MLFLGVNGTERLVGNGLLESIVFGTTAGLRASQTILNSSIKLDSWTPLKLRYRTKVNITYYHYYYDCNYDS